MKTKRVIALLLCVSLLLLLIAGCAESEDDTDYDPVDEELTTEPVGEVDEGDPPSEWEDDYPTIPSTIDFEAALATFHPDTVMIRAEGLVVTWAEIYVYLFDTFMRQLEALGGELDLDEDSAIADMILDHVVEIIESNLVYLYGFNAMGLVFSDEDLASFNDDIAGIVEMYEGVEALEENLRATAGYYNFDVFVEIFRNQRIVFQLFDEFFGENVSLFDEEVSQYASENGYMMALHILRLKTGEDDAVARSEAEDILAELRDQEGSDNFLDFFKAIMHEQSEDMGGLMSFPDGYLFQHFDMVDEFSDATEELAIWGLSDVVETVHGFHIILRLPIDYDAVPINASATGMPLTLRQFVALEMFGELEQEWRDSIEIEFTPEFYQIDVASLFRPQ